MRPAPMHAVSSRASGAYDSPVATVVSLATSRDGDPTAANSKPGRSLICG